ncbi:(Fe-S)-binding protein [Desulfotalea psychrophila]|uniref:Glycolate oxidase iron-sulfur subunit n=1 Tax=Desulfotalea psychrophila (strain LSv54 / DSM 12343) TaxID=177439 RepID=Q6AM88_DESPS|nr:(Fe-S)-binding protein [Desulfotalea psychrophila]CAG36537.1 related to glycolate oxidase, iron-sulfur subunit [Desulfotalea psychrophila LSv54]
MKKGQTKKGPEKECARCGACTVVCPVYRASGGKEFYSSRGRQHLQKIGEDASGADVKDIFSKCLLCGACSQVCPRGIDTLAHVRQVRSEITVIPGGYKKYLAGKALERPQMLVHLRKIALHLDRLLAKGLPAESGLRLRLAMLSEDHLTDSKESEATAPCPLPTDPDLQPLLYFPGCATSYITPALLEKHRRFFATLGYSLQVPTGLSCCGLSAFSAGDLAGARRLAEKNIIALEKTEGPILVSCASCFFQLHSLENVFADEKAWQERAKRISGRCVELTEFLQTLKKDEKKSEEKAVNEQKNLRVFYHDPCHFRNELNIVDEPRKLLKECSGIELVELADGPQCCGMGGLFSLAAMKISTAIRDDLRDKVLALNPDIITTTCSGCLMQWRSAVASAGSTIKVVHLTEILAKHRHFQQGKKRAGSST